MFFIRKSKSTGRKGQNLTEYAILLILVMGAFIAMSMYVKRGIQGRWKEAVDDFGEQYDPTSTVSSIVYTTNTETNTFINAIQGVEGFFTERRDVSTTNEQKSGATQVGAN